MRIIFRAYSTWLSLRVLSCLILALLSLSTTAHTEQRPSESIVIDRSLLNIAGDIFTLQDFYRFSAIAPLEDINQLRTNKRLADLYQFFITSKILHKEAEKLGVPLRPQDYDRYIEQVAIQNSLTAQEFLKQLESSGQNMPAYKAQVEVDILRARIFSRLLNSSVAVSQSEVDDFIATRSDLIASPGEVLLLRQILIQPGPDAERKIEAVTSQLAAEGSNFSEIARTFSDSPDADTGGLIGLVAEADLAEDFSKATRSLEANQTSTWVARSDGSYLLHVEKRFEAVSESDPELVEAAQTVLSEESRVRKAQQFFGPDLLKKYPVVELF